MNNEKTVENLHVSQHSSNEMLGADLDWCASFESKVETLRILNIIESSFSEKGKKVRKDLEEWIGNNADKYLTLTGR